MSSIRRLHGNGRLSKAVVHDGIVYLTGQVAEDHPGDSITEASTLPRSVCDHALVNAGLDGASTASDLGTWLNDVLGGRRAGAIVVALGTNDALQGRDQKAIEQLSRAALEAPNSGHPVAYLAAAYALVGRQQEAREALEHHLKLWPNTTLSNFEPLVGTAAFNSKMERVLEGLRLAGLRQ